MGQPAIRSARRCILTGPGRPQVQERGAAGKRESEVHWLSFRSRFGPTGRRRLRTTAAALTTVLATLLVWFALVAPNEIARLTPAVFLRIPVEGIVVVAIVLVLPVRAGRIVAGLVGLLLGVLTIVKILDMGFFAAFDRPFNPVTDRGYFGPALAVARDSIGETKANVLGVLAALLAVAIVVLMPLAVLRLTGLVTRHPTFSIRTATALGVVWTLCALLGAQFVQGEPIASTSASGLAYDQVQEVRAGIQDREVFAEEAAVDAFRDTPGEELLTGLRGKDVIFAIVESYGRVAVEDPTFSPEVNAVLEAGTSPRRAAGFSSRSAFLTSSTFGGLSWLAHATLQSGLWVDNQQRYDDLLASDRLTLASAFKRAGWRTVDDVPSNTRDWPEGESFYQYDKVYDSRNVGYRGPKFSYAAMPDQ